MERLPLEIDLGLLSFYKSISQSIILIYTLENLKSVPQALI